MDRSELEHYASRIRRRSRVLEERVVGLRMVALEQTLTRAVRAGASAARMVGKEIDILQSGGQVQIDKTLADTIFEPLLHLMRNAVDHGIESEPDRVRAGKNARGLVRLSASSTGEQVVLTLSDDGRGIDSDLILTTARARGLVRADEPLTKQQCLRLIFKPGFSTASEVSNMSGRGVGLDVVETRVAQVGGDLRIVTTPGVGTMFEVVLPATLAMVSSLIVRSGPYCYCIPASHVAGIGYVNAYDVMQGDDYATVEWHDETMPFVNLCDVLAEPERNAPAGDQIQIVVVPIAASGSDGGADVGSSHMAAVAVDCWEGRQDVLVRNLGACASHWLGVQGATELVDGRVALLLDLPSLLSANLDSIA
jgi:two-component system, chemotaxis family, sensor kinase CheA